MPAIALAFTLLLSDVLELGGVVVGLAELEIIMDLEFEEMMVELDESDEVEEPVGLDFEGLIVGLEETDEVEELGLDAG